MTVKKPNLKLIDTVICRTPAFSVAEEKNACWPQLKQLIKDSSPEFYQVIAGMDDEQLNQTNQKTRFSIWKYFNRARFRSTPFGNFAALSFVQAAIVGKAAPQLTINSRMQSWQYTDWSAKDDCMPNARRTVQTSAWFQSNTTCYVVGEQLRYIKYTDGQFELASVANFDELNILITTCRSKQNKQSIYELMKSVFGMSSYSVDNMLSQLIECQLLLTDLMPNIIGEDYFTRLNMPATIKAQQYIIAERNVNNGRLNAQTLQMIPEYLVFIKDFLPSAKNSHLEKFKSGFSKKFDRQAIPLSIALDPETGIGYGNTAHDPDESALHELFGNTGSNETVQFNYTAQHRFLLNEMIKGETICLEKFGAEVNDNQQALPNTLSVMFQMYNNMPVLQNNGGCTANALLGRFTLGCESARDQADKIVSIEEAANPDVLFFDIAYQAEKRIDNVNRRQKIYNYELPILTWSCSNSVICLDDILVMTRNNDIILWSKKHNKRLIPRVASAYNYTRSDLAVYRFLCDLQHQGIRSDLSFNFRNLFPGLDRYPRVTYKNIIVSPAMWRVDGQMFSSLTNKNTLFVLLKNWFQANNIHGYFKCGDTDQTLCFNTEDQQDIEAFLMYCRQNGTKELFIQEALIDETSTIPDENGKPYLPQYIANYFHKFSIYNQAFVVPEYRIRTNNTYLTGSKWLYFEIYCHPQRANDVLEQYLSPVIVNQKKHLQKWFFIRYTDPKPHIRLRFQLKDDTMAGHMIAEVRLALQPLFATGLISDLQLKTYNREAERYGKHRMDMVEDFFYLDSKYVLRLLSQNYSTNQLYHITLKIMNVYFDSAFTNIEERLSLIKAVADNFGKEFKVNNDGYKAINKSFELFIADKGNYNLPASESFIKQYNSAFNKIIINCNKHEKAQMVADLLHMHINRVFYSSQRMHEAVLYQYLQKLVKVQKHRAVAQPALL